MAQQESPAFKQLKDQLREMFQLDRGDLDFGIYRIMNQKRGEVTKFLDDQLLPQVRTILEEYQPASASSTQDELNKLLASLNDAGVDPETSPKVKELRAKLSQSVDINKLENEIYSDLYNFFKRYYSEGDFMSMRRYKEGVYALPYEGEEVKLHWANHDQYYIKTSEDLKNYSFKTAGGKKRVRFEVVAGGTETNNNKAAEGKERRFILHADAPVQANGDELIIRFEYRPDDAKRKQDDLNKDALEQILNLAEATTFGLKDKAPSEKNADRTLLEKHLTEYTAKNSFDYFIHKDLGKFLRQELDFFIKNEIMHLDDIENETAPKVETYLAKVKAMRKVAGKIIQFLAQLEDFQKKLWLKKKMVVECNYCITLDRVPKELYPEILNNQAQLQEWIKLFAIDEIKEQKAGGLFPEDKIGFTNPLTLEFLNQNPYLVLDTAFFSETFKWQLISSMEDFDEQCDGTLINTDNFHGLNLLQKKYKSQIQSLYTDPPYNTSASEILYKNSFKHSSWISMLDSRVFLSKELLKETGAACYTIDDFEVAYLKTLLDQHFISENHLATTPIRNNPSGRSTVKGFSINHEYGIFYSKTENVELGRLPHKEKQKERYNLSDDIGNYEWENLRRNGPDSNRNDRPKQYYPIFCNEKSLIWRIPEMEYDEMSKKWIVNDKLQVDEIELLPIHPNGEEKVWRYSVDNLINEPDRFKIESKETGLEVYRKKYLNNEGILPRTWWEDASYSARDNGTRELVELFGNEKLFDFPKSKFAVKDSLKVLNTKEKDIVLDYFGGSATTGHATIDLNRDDSGCRKFILMEMGAYFDIITKPRIQKAIYSKDWKDGKPVNREGISQCFKYMRLESYEDTLNNLALKQTETQQQALAMNPTFKEGYMLNYMLDVEAKDSLLNLEWFVNPFNCYLNITKNNELQPTKVDLVETFNYLIGLVVESYAQPKDGYVVVTGKNLAGEKILVVWRDCTQHNSTALNQFLEKSKYNPLDAEFDRIYVNGDNNVENLKTGDERWKVVLIEEEFGKRMFEMN